MAVKHDTKKRQLLCTARRLARVVAKELRGYGFSLLRSKKPLRFGLVKSAMLQANYDGTSPNAAFVNQIAREFASAAVKSNCRKVCFLRPLVGVASATATCGSICVRVIQYYDLYSNRMVEQFHLLLVERA